MVRRMAGIIDAWVGGGGGIGKIATGIATGLLTTGCYSVVRRRPQTSENINEMGIFCTA